MSIFNMFLTSEPVVVMRPTVSVESYTYNGSEKGPTITYATNTQDKITTTDATNIYPGEYTLTFHLNSSSYTWDDGTTDDITYDWYIDKATRTLSYMPTGYVKLTSLSTTATVTVTSNPSLGEWDYNNMTAVSSSQYVVSVMVRVSSSNLRLTLTRANNASDALVSNTIITVTAPETSLYSSDTLIIRCSSR